MLQGGFKFLGGLRTSSSLGLLIEEVGVEIKPPVNSCRSQTGSRLCSCQAQFWVKTRAEGLGDAGPPCPMTSKHECEL